MVFRRDSKVDAFQRQISALRHQLGGEHDHDRFALQAYDHSSEPRRDTTYRTDFPDLDPIGRDSPATLRDLIEPAEHREPATALPAVPAIDTLTSVIAHTTVWSGNLESTGSLHIHGRVEGSLTARDDVFVAEEADVDAVIKAANVTVAGNVRGSIHCAERFEVLPRGRVAGDVRSPVVVIHEGALVAGEIAMAPSGEAKASLSPTSAARAARGGD